MEKSNKDKTGKNFNKKSNKKQPFQADWFPTFNMQNLYLSKGDISMENLGFAFDWEENIDAVALEKSVFDLEQHFDNTRLYFKQESQSWLQKIAPPEKKATSLSFIDLTQINAKQFESTWRSTCAAITESFDINTPALFRVIVFWSPDGLPTRLAIMLNHLISDGYSMVVMLNYLYNRYSCYLEGKEHSEKTTHYSIAAYCKLIDKCLNEPFLKQKLQHWLDKKIWSQPKIGFDKQTVCGVYNKQHRPKHYEMKNYTKKNLYFDKNQTTKLTKALQLKSGLDLENGILLIIVHSLAQQYGPGFLPVWITDSARDLDNKNNTVMMNLCGLIATHVIVGFSVNPELDINVWLNQTKEVLAQVRGNTSQFSAVYYNNLPTNQLEPNELEYIKQIDHPEIIFNFVRLSYTKQQLSKLIPLEGTQSQNGREYYGISFSSELYLNELVLIIRYNRLFYTEAFIDHLAHEITGLITSVSELPTKKKRVLEII